MKNPTLGVIYIVLFPVWIVALIIFGHILLNFPSGSEGFRATFQMGVVLTIGVWITIAVDFFVRILDRRLGFTELFLYMIFGVLALPYSLIFTFGILVVVAVVQLVLLLFNVGWAEGSWFGICLVAFFILMAIGSLFSKGGMDVLLVIFSLRKK